MTTPTTTQHAAAPPPIGVTAPPEMGAADQELLRIAEALLHRVFVHGRHEVATALRTVDGQIFTGVHLEGSCRRSSICAEGVALGAARTGLPAGTALQVTAIVSVQIKPAGQFRVIAPCGVCRELISDYCPDAVVWVTAGEDVVSFLSLDLLPEKSRRRW